MSKHAQFLSNLPMSERSKDLVQSLFFAAGPLQFDFHHQYIGKTLLEYFVTEAKSNGLNDKIQSLFNGGHVNPTEDRPALHWLLRANKEQVPANLVTEYQQIQATAQLMTHFADSVINGDYIASADTPIKHIINLGVGGSDLGPRLAYSALKAYHNDLQVHFVANVDGHDFVDTVQNLDPNSCLFVVTSKTFSTLETLENTKAAYNWLQTCGIKTPGAHFAAATSRPDKAAEFGIEESRIFPMWDWVGGRYSLLSSVGLALLLGIGSKAFADIKKGAQSIDTHFQNTEYEHNAPFLHAMAGITSVNGLGIKNHAVIAYDSRFELLPSYLQQLEMESNGKSVDLNGNKIDYNTCPILWGGVGTNTQHSFHQLLHQGTIQSNIDFLLPLEQDHGLPEHQAYLQANCFAQVEALTHGKTLQQVKAELKTQGLDQKEIDALAPHKVIAGHKTCTIIGYKKLSPEVLGAVIAFYEHKVFVQAHFWNINPFDQWGVELGKQLCDPVFKALQDDLVPAASQNTQRWIDFIHQR